MIWIWIFAAVLISWLFCRKKVRWQHYIWILLPIEMYGFTVAGATIKPYMVFGIAIILYNNVRTRVARLPRTIVVMAFLLILSDIINGLILGSIMQHLMFIFILIIASSYLTSQDGIIDFNQISIVAIATTVGYGLIFTIAYLSTFFNISLPDVYTTDRYSTGMIVRSIITGYGNAVTIRLRGFGIDPNGVVTTLIPGAAFALANLLYRKEKTFISILAVILFFLVVDYSGSRMALISSFIMVAIMFVIGYRETDHKLQWIIIAFVVLAGLGIFVVINQNRIITEIAYNLDYFFSSRASLTDNAGRLTIWKNNLSYLVENNRILFGLGQNQISNYTVQEKACHNTWLEWICGTGLFIGIFINLFFITATVPFSRKAKESKLIYRQDALPVILAYIIVMISITTVDNITNSILLILAIFFRYGTPSRETQEGLL